MIRKQRWTWELTMGLDRFGFKILYLITTARNWSWCRLMTRTWKMKMKIITIITTLRNKGGIEKLSSVGRMISAVSPTLIEPQMRTWSSSTGITTKSKARKTRRQENLSRTMRSESAFQKAWGKNRIRNRSSCRSRATTRRSRKHYKMESGPIW